MKVTYTQMSCTLLYIHNRNEVWITSVLSGMTQKQKATCEKHGITFDQATEVFSDPFALTIQDRIEHGEQRWQTLGETPDTLTLLLVAHTLYDDDLGIEVIRIISARRADRQERKIYHGHRQKNLV